MKNLGGRISAKCPVEHRPVVEGSLSNRSIFGAGIDAKYHQVLISISHLCMGSAKLTEGDSIGEVCFYVHLVATVPL